MNSFRDIKESLGESVGLNMISTIWYRLETLQIFRIFFKFLVSIKVRLAKNNSNCFLSSLHKMQGAEFGNKRLALP